LDSNAGCADHNFHPFGWQRGSLDQKTSVVRPDRMGQLEMQVSGRERLHGKQQSTGE
jgi:hypothetical protein